MSHRHEGSRKILFQQLLACAIGTLCAATSDGAEEANPQRPVRYSGMCDASAAVALNEATFLVADDERNTLQVYRADRAGPPVRSLPWDAPLGIGPEDKHPEVDIEGATLLSGLAVASPSQRRWGPAQEGQVYWISSHGRNKNGKLRPNRHRFFALTVIVSGNRILAEPFGKPCRTLILDLIEDKRMRELGLAKALGTGKGESGKLAPKREGLNIEGLAATADGESLLIAFRNPRPEGKALLVPLNNPAAVLAEEAAPEFGEPILLRLEVKSAGRSLRLGIRSIEYSGRHAAYLIVAGPHDERNVFALYRWSGRNNDPPKLLRRATAVVNRIGDFTPEALIVYPRREKIQLLSDDGTLPVKVRSPAECEEGTFENGICRAKYLLDNSRKTFRSVWIDVE